MSLAHLRHIWQSADPASSALRLTFWYTIIGGAWIAFSDRILAFIISDTESLTKWQTAKGWLFVLVMAGWLGWERWNTLKQSQRVNDELRALNTSLEQRIAEHIAPLQAANAELSQINQELETFTATISHDLKAPLRVIEGYSQLLLRFHAHRLDDDGKQCLNSICTATTHMNQLIDDLLAYNHIERKVLEYAEINLESIIEQILAIHADQIETRGVTVEQDIRCPVMRGDEIGITLALRNLIDNALKFTTYVPRPRLTIGTEALGNTVRLWVKDNGIGFDIRHHDRIFAIFQRLHPQDAYPGSGVGLAIVQKAIERMGGRVWAESSPGAGAIFYLEIPNATASPAFVAN